jgi:hypothetical protein
VVWSAVVRTFSPSSPEIRSSLKCPNHLSPFDQV